LFKDDRVDAPSEVRQRSANRPRPLLAAAHLAAIWALAFVQPLFDLLGRNTAFFVARGNDAGDILGFALIFTLGPFLVAWLVEAILERFVPRVRWGLHLTLLAVLIACLALQLLGQVMQRPAGLMIAVSLAVGVALARFYARGRFLRSVLDVLTPAPLIVLLLFLVLGPTSKLVLPGNEPKALALDIKQPAPVVMVIFDEFPLGSMMTPKGEIDASRFPNMAAVAEAGTWYRNATTTGAFTTLAVPAILTGRQPTSGQLPTANDQPESIFTLLGGSYDLNVMEDATSLCPKKLCPEQAKRTVSSGLRPLFDDLWIVSQHLLLPRALRQGLPDVSQTFGGFAAEIEGGAPTGVARGGNAHVVAMAFARGSDDDESRRVAEFVGRIGEVGEPSLNLIHIEKPHYPWQRLPDGRIYSPGRGEWVRFVDEDSVWQTTEQVTDIALQRHLLEAGYADTLLGEIIKRVKDEGLWEESLFVVVADHGGAVSPGLPRRNPAPGNMGQVASMPLFIKAPGQKRGEIVDRHICTIDLLPEMARHLGIDYPWQVADCPDDVLTVGDLPDGEVEAPIEDMFVQRDEYVDRIQRLFGTGAGWSAVFNPREGRELVGTRPAPAPARPGQSASPLEQATTYSESAPSVPVLLQRGRLTGIEPGALLAVTVNGRVAATGQAFDLSGETVYSILLPPESLREGENEIKIGLVVGEPGSRRLQPL
jgi:hypothetical protein